tara:strand:+ start:766 stop:885 length:120 start_codon:yes stop_codon:yes gene_type:complete
LQTWFIINASLVVVDELRRTTIESRSHEFVGGGATNKYF